MPSRGHAASGLSGFARRVTRSPTRCSTRSTEQVSVMTRVSSRVRVTTPPRSRRWPESGCVLDTPFVLRAPREPYRVGKPYWRRGNGLLELPIGVTPLQLPYIGTSLVLGGEKIAARLTRQMLGRELINLELHAIDAADATEDGLATLAPHRADLRRTAADKLGSLRAAIEVIRDAGYELVTLEEAARRIRAQPTQ